MAKVKRQVIKIDEDLCNGCGQCVPSCAEGAIQIIDGKAKLVSDKYCDGLGACLGECPMGALSFEEREAEEFDEAAVEEHMKSIGREFKPQAHAHAPAPAPTAGHHGHHHGGGGCPSARMMDFRRDEDEVEDDQPQAQMKSQLRQWPVKLFLVNPDAPYFKDADLLLAADCTAFAYASIHPDYMKNKAVAIGCPKFDDVQVYVDKLTQIIKKNNIKSVTVLHMEVPCCFGMMYVAKEAVEAAEVNIPVIPVTVSLKGEIKETTGLASLM
jgi:NAD-dependent dihydropyrimidine dehydrogenase PreA subunit